MRARTIVLASLALLCAVSVSRAQSDSVTGVPAWGLWGSAPHHSSTAAEGAMRGMADVTRSAGAANLMNSQAAGYWQDATRKYIENRQYGAETYFDMRAQNKAAREAERGPRPSQEDLVRYSQSRMPDRLSPSELDPLTGQIGWPPALRDDYYKQYRDALNSLYDQRSAAGGYLDVSQRAEVKRLASYMKDDLKKNIDSYSSSEYLQAKRFIEGLSYELYAPTS